MLSQLIQKLAAALTPDEQRQVVILGSSAIALHAVPFRKTQDLDVFVSEETFQKLATRFPVAYKLAENGDKVARLIPAQDIEIFKSFPGLLFQDVLAHATKTKSSGPFLVAALADVKQWKQTQGRKKDREDLEVLDNYLNTRA